MTILSCIALLQFATTLALGQLARQSEPTTAPKQPEAMVRSLYREVVARHPVGIPKDADMKIFAPYLSKALLDRIDLAHACEDDYYRRYQKPNEKPSIEWLEFGLFTGGMEEAAPQKFRVLATEPKKDGSFRVYVELIILYGIPTDPEPLVWHVAATVVRENGQFAVDDVIFLKDYSTLEKEFRLSEVLRTGCKGPRWVGSPNQGNASKEQK